MEACGVGRQVDGQASRHPAKKKTKHQATMKYNNDNNNNNNNNNIENAAIPQIMQKSQLLIS